MKNSKVNYKRIQERLDKRKWLVSEQAGYDLSGGMHYCAQCPKADHTDRTGNCNCYATQEERYDNRLCARQYVLLDEKQKEFYEKGDTKCLKK